MTRLTRKLLVAVLLGVAVYAAFVFYTGYRDLEQALRGFRWSAFGAALLLATMNYALRFAKWEYYLKRLEIRGVPKLDSLLIFLSGFVLTITPGKLGEVFKSAVLRSTHGVPIARTAPIVLAERLTDVIGVTALIAFGVTGFSDGLPWALAGAAAVAAVLSLVLWQTPLRAGVRWCERRGGKLARLAPKLHESLASLRVVASPSALLWPTLLSVIGWGLEGVALYLLLQGFGSAVPLPLAVFFYATATLAGALIPVPGGLGVAEAMIQEQLVRLGGAPAPTATAAMILIRFATLWWAVLLGFAALGLLKLRAPGLEVARAAEAEPPDAARG